ncbi:MAG: hypothetical protein A2W91_09500 [Bacteroidetes bacterium GWF2_38_335]|nr:MAG: hypothetical protein A2W91_09500 [Bacteroidetes bacterium GWF2_38_335]OFY80798.1 MAG: hypothetical protein A2281_09000 [Bacteroidetes bacterium RIFOXYA12_FULL_38_20]
MRTFIKFLTLIFLSIHVSAQDHETEILKAVNSVFEGMRNQDSSLVRSVFKSDAILFSIDEKDGKTDAVESSLDDFLKAIGSKHLKVWDERLFYTDVKIEGNFAMVWADYIFYYGSELYHCGVDLFQLVNDKGKWKITQITDTRSKENCGSKITNEDSVKKELNTFMDEWHKNAAEADTAYFEKISPKGIYIGTDITELWVRDEFFTWARKFFERKSAWDFKAKNRNIYLSSDPGFAWFDEVLDTWMGDCRASGVLKKYNGVWKIEHYQLSMAVPNEKTQEVIKIINNK